MNWDFLAGLKTYIGIIMAAIAFVTKTFFGLEIDTEALTALALSSWNEFAVIVGLVVALYGKVMSGLREAGLLKALEDK